MESLLAIQVHRCFLRKSQKSMLVVFPRENAAVLYCSASFQLCFGENVKTVFTTLWLVERTGH